MSKQPTISLVLGSGGARGISHIGVIRWFEEYDFRIESISGSSMGALVGAVYACGKLDEFAQWLVALDKVDILRLLDVSMSDGGFVKGDRIIDALKELVGDHKIEDLPVSYTAVASDIENEKEIWLNKGPVFDAVRASISLPLFFSPAKLKGKRLLDGGILNPVPIAPTFSDGTDYTVAVNLNGTPSADAPPPAKTTDESSEGLKKTVSAFIDQLAEKSLSKLKVDLDVFDIANQTFDAMQGAIARQKLSVYPPDALIEVPRNACGTLEFDRAEEMIELGYNCTAKAMADLVNSSKKSS